MAYDETLAVRIREIIGGIDGEVTERKMFGGLALMLNGHMFTGVVGDELMLRLGDAGAEAALRREHVREIDFTGRPMKAMVFVESAGLHGDALGEWVTSAVAFAQSLPPKSRLTGRRSYAAGCRTKARPVCRDGRPRGLISSSRRRSGPVLKNMIEFHSACHGETRFTGRVTSDCSTRMNDMCAVARTSHRETSSAESAI